MSFDFQGNEALRGRVTRALTRVVDPEMSLDIVNLGLVIGVRAVAGSAEVRMTMTSAACPVAEIIMADVADSLRRELGEDFAVDVQLVWDPPWTPEHMSERARAVMGW
jgi:metal-sulfur cluster biosynthetic enzyme